MGACSLPSWMVFFALAVVGVLLLWWAGAVTLIRIRNLPLVSSSHVGWPDFTLNDVDQAESSHGLQSKSSTLALRSGELYLSPIGWKQANSSEGTLLSFALYYYRDGQDHERSYCLGSWESFDMPRVACSSVFHPAASEGVGTGRKEK
ncbi:hypothetical protein DFJ73DRAFT_769986 [Zopfochytrium polystomum]|nr:hypothetical protein DFJ73DRAFT_769986 [Zopfochytrium polystomum]